MVIWRSIIDWWISKIYLWSIKIRFMELHNSIYGSPELHWWRSIITNCEAPSVTPIYEATKLTYGISYFKLWSSIDQIWSSIDDLWSSINQMWSAVYISTTEVHNSHLWSSIILNMELHNDRYDVTFRGFLSSTQIFMELHNLNYGAP